MLTGTSEKPGLLGSAARVLMTTAPILWIRKHPQINRWINRMLNDGQCFKNGTVALVVGGRWRMVYGWAMPDLGGE